MLIMKRYIRSTTSDTTDITHDINKIRRNARLAAKRDGYDQVIILDRDGEYCFSRKCVRGKLNLTCIAIG